MSTLDSNCKFNWLAPGVLLTFSRGSRKRIMVGGRSNTSRYSIYTMVDGEGIQSYWSVPNAYSLGEGGGSYYFGI